MTRKTFRKHFDRMAAIYIKALAETCSRVDWTDMYRRRAFMVVAAGLTVTDGGKDNQAARRRYLRNSMQH
jgi:hypothetical protein